LGAGVDPCGVLGTTVTLGAGREATIVVTLGEGATEEEARTLVRRYRERAPAAVLQDATAGWKALLGTVQVHTPDPALDVLVNHWLLYQTVSSRLWGRAAFYQASGAYGFRDQLQDVAALVLTRPDLTREHLLRAAAHQFVEGDVLHWWHPPTDHGVRTRISDDRLWLPYVTSHYLDVTGDDAVLDERVPFLAGPAVPPDREDLYDAFRPSDESGSLYEHCARAIDVSLAIGRHGLPLIGTGDWNDGMNRVGHLGQGESVWLAWFLLAVFDPWIVLARSRGDTDRAARWTEHGAGLRRAVEADGWDGDWYRRAFTDDGVALGSASGVECRIDSIAQSWAVLSGAGRLDRVARAMAAVDEHLVRRADGTVLLLAPPFDRSPIDPGYIKGYLPGIRENGGQYAHAAAWVAMAFAELGDGARAAEILSMINPIHRSSSRAGLLRYKAEPYAVAADVYGTEPLVGRAGWTWYTGSAAWMYRATLEWLLGIRVRRGVLHLAPCVPPSWPGFEVVLLLGGARTVVRVDNTARSGRGIVGLALDGAALDPEVAEVPLPKSGEHRVDVVLGRPDTRTEA
jgi:cyclic beta-1,2-glucan synthetase